MKPVVGTANNTRIAHQLVIANLRLQPRAVAKRRPFKTIIAVREMKTILTVLNKIRKQINFLLCLTK
jgi:hypothetical protein